MESSIKDLAARHRKYVETAKVCLDMADNARVSGMHDAHDLLVEVAQKYTTKFRAVHNEALKLFSLEECLEAFTPEPKETK